MPVERLDANTVKFTVGVLQATVHTSDQYVNVMCNDMIVGTIQRRRVISKDVYQWSIYDCDGGYLGSHDMVSPLLHILRRDLLQEA